MRFMCHAICPDCGAPLWFDGTRSYGQQCCSWYFFCANGPLYRHKIRRASPWEMQETFADLVEANFDEDEAWACAQRWERDPLGAEIGNAFTTRLEVEMRERERLEDFRGGHVACRGCKRLLFFTAGVLQKLTCCGYLYSPEPGPVDLVIYDRTAPVDLVGAEEAFPPTSVEVASAPEDHAWDGGEPGFPIDPSTPEDAEEPEEAFAPSEEEEAEVERLVANAATLAERSQARQAQLRQRGPRYD